MRRAIVCLCIFASSGAAANLAGTWKFIPPPNPQAPPNRQPRETIYVFKVDGAHFTGTLVLNGGMSDIRNGAIDGTRLTFDRYDANGRTTPYKGELAGDELTVQLVNPPAPVPGRGGRGPQGPTVLKKSSEDTEYKVASALAHKALPPFKAIPANGYAKTPPMGWNSWNKFNNKVDDASVRGMADAIAASGMRDAGYVYVNIDDTWEGKERDKDGNITTNEKFPDMKALADYVHAKGLKLGIYSGPGPRTCAGYLASYGHEEQDAKTWAAWGIDYLKYDWCSASEVYHPDELKSAYLKMGLALRATKRPMIYSLCQYGWQDVGEWGAAAGGNLWRTTGDISDHWWSMSSLGFDNQTSREKFAGPGHWNDPDMLEVGNGGMTDTEYRTHMSLWALLAAPLLAGNDIRNMTDATKEILMNKEVIAVDQDREGVQGVALRKEGECTLAPQNRPATQIACREVWKKQLANGVAVGLFNRGEEPAKISVKWSEVGVNKKNPKVRDLWAHKDVDAASEFSADVPAHGVVMLTVR
jgi:alpha-galactosidase